MSFVCKWHTNHQSPHAACRTQGARRFDLLGLGRLQWFPDSTAPAQHRVRRNGGLYARIAVDTIGPCFNNSTLKPERQLQARSWGEGGLGGSEDPRYFQNFTRLEAVIHSLLQLSLIVQRKQWKFVALFQFVSLPLQQFYWRPLPDSPPVRPTAACRGASAPDVETSAH